MTSNNALLRGKPFNWLKRRLYRDPVNDIRPTWIPKVMAHVGGTTAELIVPAVLVFAAGNHPWRWALIAFMVIFHLNIISNLPMGVPLEWNIFFIFSLFYLFGHYSNIVIYDLSSPLLLAMLMVALAVIPVVGNMFPQQISFLPALRYYAGNWASSVWCFRAGVEDKIEASVVKSSALTATQIARLYDTNTAEIISDKARAFRSMHVHGRALNGLLPRALGNDANEADYALREGETVAGPLIGWNFGEGHLHNEQLVEAVQRRCQLGRGRSAGDHPGRPADPDEKAVVPHRRCQDRLDRGGLCRRRRHAGPPALARARRRTARPPGHHAVNARSRDLNHRISDPLPQLLGWQRAFRRHRRRYT